MFCFKEYMYLFYQFTKTLWTHCSLKMLSEVFFTSGSLKLDCFVKAKKKERKKERKELRERKNEKKRESKRKRKKEKKKERKKEKN